MVGYRRTQRLAGMNAHLRLIVILWSSSFDYAYIPWVNYHALPWSNE